MVEEDQPVKWIEADESPWGIRVLDIRPLLARGLIAASKNIDEAKNAVSFGGEDGTAFIGCEPPSPRVVDVGYRYPVVGRFPDCAVYRPRAMEEKWAIFVVGGRIVFVWSWAREVRVVADVEQDESGLLVTRAHGFFLREDESDDFTRRALDFLMSAYAQGIVHPAPFPETVTRAEPERLALETMSAFGLRALFGASVAGDRIAYREA